MAPALKPQMLILGSLTLDRDRKVVTLEDREYPCLTQGGDRESGRNVLIRAGSGADGWAAFSC